MLVLTGALAGGCDPATYTDVHFGTNVGADYMAPTRDASDGPDDAAAGAAGTSSAAGTGGSAGATGAAGTGT